MRAGRNVRPDGWRQSVAAGALVRTDDATGRVRRPSCERPGAPAPGAATTVSRRTGENADIAMLSIAATSIAGHGAPIAKGPARGLVTGGIPV